MKNKRPILKKGNLLKYLKRLEKRQYKYPTCLEGDTRFDVARQIAYEYGFCIALEHIKEYVKDREVCKEESNG